MQKNPNIHIGSPAWGNDFYNRDAEIEECWDKLEYSSIIISAPRRYGKSSVMISLRNNPHKDFFPIYFELEDHSTLHGFIYEFISKLFESDNSLRNTLKTIFSKIFDNIEELSMWEFKLKLREFLKKEDDWEELKEKINRLMLDLLKFKKHKKLLLIFDEFPMMLYNFINQGKKGEDEAQKVLEWLRKLRHESPFLESVRFIFGGSIAIEKIVSFIKATRTVSDMACVSIGAFDKITAENFIKDIFKSNEIEAGNKIVDAIMKTVGTLIPIYLQIMIDSVIKEAKNTEREISPELIKYCYEKRVHGPEYKTYFEDYYERLWRYYNPEDMRSVRRILKELSSSENGISYETLFLIYKSELGNNVDKNKFELLLKALENDFYIECNLIDAKVYFRNKWLKDWWRIYHGF